LSEVAALRSDSATVAFQRERDAAQGVLYYKAAAVSEGAPRERTPPPRASLLLPKFGCLPSSGSTVCCGFRAGA